MTIAMHEWELVLQPTKTKSTFNALEKTCEALNRHLILYRLYPYKQKVK